MSDRRILRIPSHLSLCEVSAVFCASRSPRIPATCGWVSASIAALVTTRPSRTGPVASVRFLGTALPIIQNGLCLRPAPSPLPFRSWRRWVVLSLAPGHCLPGAWGAPVATERPADNRGAKGAPERPRLRPARARLSRRPEALPLCSVRGRHASRDPKSRRGYADL